MASSVRVRFAPSPTGHLHIGNARTAVLNWIFAKKHKGRFVLRIEDTDLDRAAELSESSILADLKWLGLNWHEGPEIGGSYGPYRQSERLQTYSDYIEKLRDQDQIYPCYLSEKELEEIRNMALERGDPAPYTRKNLEHSESEKRRFEDAGKKPLWLFAVEPGEIKWNDLVKGRLSFDGENVGDFVVIRSNGIPTYNFAAAVDDALMGITHVIRGDDHVSNTPKQILLYEALGFSVPLFAHIPLILGRDRTRLSKRHGATSVQEFRDKGYLPEALINFLSLLSWSSESGDEILSFDRLVREFDFQRMSKSPAIFDTNKLNWMNGQYIHNLHIDEFHRLVKTFLDGTDIDISDDEKLNKVLSLLQSGVDHLSQIPELLQPFYQDSMHPTDREAIAISLRDSSQKIYWAFLRYLQNYDHLESKTFLVIMKQVQKETGIMGKELWEPIRVALTGKVHGPDLPQIAEILGKEKIERYVRSLVE